MARVLTGFLAAVLLIIVAAKFASNMSMDTGDEPVNEAWAQQEMEFVTWNDGRWTAWIHNGVFEQTPQDAVNWSRHSSPSIAFTDWAGDPCSKLSSYKFFAYAKCSLLNGQGRS